MALLPTPVYPQEPTILYSVSYYPTNSLNQAPNYTDPVMYSKNAAIQRARSLILAAGNIGVCTVSVVTADIIYPAIPFVAF